MEPLQGHVEARLNGICPYFTMFPLGFPHKILRRHSKASDFVIDPFCGRGTTSFAARLLGLNSLGIDTSPVAVAVTNAKLVAVETREIVRRVRQILWTKIDDVEVPKGTFWTYAFHQRTLFKICKIRHALLDGKEDRVDNAVRGLMLGALHGPVNVGKPSYFSNQCPRTFAPKPSYAVKYWRRHRLKPIDVDVVSIIRRRAMRYYTGAPVTAFGRAVEGDSRHKTSYSLPPGARGNWVITSPPYYGLCTYVQDQWLRNWFLGGPAEIDYSGGRQIRHSSPDDFSEDLAKVWNNVAARCASGASLIVRFGAINNRPNVKPLHILKDSLRGTPWRIVTAKAAGTASSGKRQAESFGTNSDAVAEYDVWARLT